MGVPLPLELVAAIAGACLVLGLLRDRSIPAPAAVERIATGGVPIPAPLSRWLRAYVFNPGWPQSVGLLLLRLAVGTMMIHHGQDKLADPESFATNYVAALHLPFPLLMAYAAGYAEIIGSWLLIFGLLTPLGALAIAGTMTVAAYHHILTSGFNIYVLELVVLYLGGSFALLLQGPGRISFDAGMAAALLSDTDNQSADEPMAIQAAAATIGTP